MKPVTASPSHHGNAPSPAAGLPGQPVASRRRALGLVCALAGVALVGPVPAARAAAPDPGPSGRQESAVCSAEWLAAGARGASLAGFAAPAWGGETESAPSRAVDPNAVLPLSARTAQELASRYPNDTYFRFYQRDSLMAIGALDAWGISRGGSDVVIAVVGTGVHLAHPDLASKLWRNPGEIAGNGLDDDGNGYVDDVVGWSFPDSSGNPQDIPRGRGTMMAGIAAAATNNEEGIAGASWGARIMPLKTLVLHSSEGGDKFVGTVGHMVEAVCYAANNGARVILFGGYLQNPSHVAEEVERLRQAVDYAHLQGAVVVAPAGDCALPQPFCPPEEYGENPPIFPAAFRHVIGVQAHSAHRTVRAEASSGPWVDITGPGGDFMATSVEPLYSHVRQQRATSDFAAALVAGVLAVMRSINPDLSPYQLEQALCASADRPRGVDFEMSNTGQLRNDQWGCGVVNFERAVRSIPPKLRVRPLSGVRLGAPADARQLVQITDGRAPWPRLHFENPFLAADAWELVADVPWVDDALAENRDDGTSRANVVADLDMLRSESGPLQSGTVYSAEVRACARGWEPARAPCQSFGYRLTFVDKLDRAFLPLVSR